MEDAPVTEREASFLRPMSELPGERLQKVRLLATDVDGTLTVNGRLSSGVLTRLEALASLGVTVVPVTGRSAGETLGLYRYLPGVVWAVAENGGVWVRADHPPQRTHPPADREVLLACARAADATLRLAPCAPFRLTDLAFEREQRGAQDIDAVARSAAAHGLFICSSSVHIHLSHHPPDKGSGLQPVLDALQVPPEAVATIGDAGNDAGLWHPGRFGLTVGTAEVRQRQSECAALPEWITSAGAEGWMALADAILAAQTS